MGVASRAGARPRGRAGWAAPAQLTALSPQSATRRIGTASAATAAPGAGTASAAAGAATAATGTSAAPPGTGGAAGTRAAGLRPGPLRAGLGALLSSLTAFFSLRGLPGASLGPPFPVWSGFSVGCALPPWGRAASLGTALCSDASSLPRLPPVLSAPSGRAGGWRPASPPQPLQLEGGLSGSSSLPRGWGAWGRCPAPALGLSALGGVRRAGETRVPSHPSPHLSLPPPANH